MKTPRAPKEQNNKQIVRGSDKGNPDASMCPMFDVKPVFSYYELKTLVVEQFNNGSRSLGYTTLIRDLQQLNAFSSNDPKNLVDEMLDKGELHWDSEARLILPPSWQSPNEHRFKDNPREKEFHDAWLKTGRDNKTLAYLLGNGVNKVEPSQKEISTSVRVMQWLGSPVGQAFLKDLGYEKRELPGEPHQRYR